MVPTLCVSGIDMRAEPPDALVLEFPGAAAAMGSSCSGEEILDCTGVFAAAVPVMRVSERLGPRYGRSSSLRVPVAALIEHVTAGELDALAEGLVLPLSAALFLDQRIRTGLPPATDAAAFAARSPRADRVRCA